MLSNRTTARGAVLALTLAVAITAASAATAGDTAARKPIVFPLLSDVPVYDNYGDPRVNGRHAGIDIEGAPRRTPVLAAEAGKVEWHTTSARAGCMLYLYGASGTTYIYIHLNNDLTLRNDNRGRCELDTAYTVKNGARVTAGEQIAYNGDSGDADGNPHLHFEVHPNDGADVNPLPYLKSAERLLFPGRLGARFTLGLRGVVRGAVPGRLTMGVTAVRWWPNGRWIELEDRIVMLKLPSGSPLTGQGGERTGASVSKQAVDGDATVFTSPAKVTPQALRGEEGALRASRLLEPSGKVVLLEPDAGADDDPPTDDDPPPRPF
jgi:peptidase M23-like protein